MRDVTAMAGFGAAGVGEETGLIADRTGFGHQAMLGQVRNGGAPATPAGWPQAGPNGRFMVQTMLHSK